jgi:hypothetical protein
MSSAPLELLASTFDSTKQVARPGSRLVGQLAPKHKMLIGSAPPTISTVSHSFTSDAACNTAMARLMRNRGNNQEFSPLIKLVCFAKKLEVDGECWRVKLKAGAEAKELR